MFCFSKKPSRESQDSDFLKLPDVVIREILTNCDLVSISNLTKVCRDLHYFIHYTPPTTFIERMNVRIGDKTVYLRFAVQETQILKVNGRLNKCLKFTTIRLYYHENGCIVWRNGVQSYMKNEDFVSVACNYLSAMLRWMGSVGHFRIDHFDAGYHYKHEFSRWEGLLCAFKKPFFEIPSSNEITTRVVETIEACLQSRGRLMQVTHLTEGLEEPHPHILNLFDPLSLESLTLPGPGKYPEFDVKRLENLKALTIQGGVSSPLQDFLHIQRLELTVESISDKEILEIKERMRYSNPGTSMKISVVPEPEPELLRLQVRLLFFLPQTGRKLQWNVINNQLMFSVSD